MMTTKMTKGRLTLMTTGHGWQAAGMGNFDQNSMMIVMTTMMKMTTTRHPREMKQMKKI
jgi:hypothetical protein